MAKTKVSKHKEKLNLPLLKFLTFISFLLGISSAAILYLESNYFKIALGSDNVTPYFIVAYVAALILIFNWHHLICRFGKSKVFLINLLIKFFIVAALAIMPINQFSIWLLVAYIALTVLTWVDLDVLLETCSKDVKTGTIRGAYLAIMNAGYLISPFFAGYILNRWGFQIVFAIAAFILLLVWILSVYKLKAIKSCQVNDLKFFPLLKKVFRRPNVMRIYYISFLLELFYALMIVYTPLYLLELGFSWTEIGKIFTIMLIPFVILQYPVGFLADKKFEEKGMLVIALIIMAIFTGWIFLSTSTSLLVWAGILFGTRIGASFIEILRDSYFYKRIDQMDVDVVDFFRSVRPMAYILGLFIAAPIVFFLHIRFVFPFVAIMMLTGVPFALKLASSRIPPAYCRLPGKIKR